MKTVGSTAAIGGAITGGSVLFGSAAAQSTVEITAENPETVTNDRGDLTKVTVDPTFSIEWEGLDTAAGKVFYVIEGRTKEDGTWNAWSPIFRSTPWLTPDSLSGVGQSKPGTTGHLELNVRLSTVLRRSAAARSALGDDPRAQPRPLQVVNEFGRPDYESVDDSAYPGGSASQFLAGTSVGSTDAVTTQLDDGRIATAEGQTVETGSTELSSLGGLLPLVNNFPGAESGYYGAAYGTDQLDVAADGESDSDQIQLRYTFALQTINQSALQYFADVTDGNGDPVFGEGNLEFVREDDIQNDEAGNSLLVMDGEDGYPSITDNGANTAAENDYDAYQAIADQHPAVISTTSTFEVTVDNEIATTGVTGDTNVGASGSGQ